MTKYFSPAYEWVCLSHNPPEMITDMLQLPRSHKNHLFVKATRFGREGEVNAKSGETPFVDLLDPDVQGKDEVTLRIAKGEKVASSTEELAAIKRSLGDTS